MMTGGSSPFQTLRSLSTKLLLVIPLLLLATTTQAATFTVNSTTDEVDANIGDGVCQTASAKCSLRAAIQEANATPTIADIITVPTGLFTLTISGVNEDQAATGDLDIAANSTITINGAGSNNTIIDGNGSDRVFQILSGATVTMSGFTVQNGNASGGIGGGIYNDGGTVTLDQVDVKNNNADNLGSTSNTGSGGGIYNSGTMTIGNCTISGNVADTTVNGGGGGGVYNFGIMSISNCTLDSNEAKDSTGNSTPGGGAAQSEGISGVGPSTNKLTITGSTISNNKAPLGGGVRSLFSRVIIDTSVIDSNTADLSGGGVENIGGNVTISRTAIRNNIAPQTGGGVDNTSTMDIGNSTIYGNQTLGISPGGTGGAGGGVFNSGDGVLTIFDTTISGNTAILGGGLYNHKEAGVTNSTIYDNTASTDGTEVYACGDKDDTAVPPLPCSTNINDSTGAQIIHTKFVNTIVGNSSTTNNCGGDVTDLITTNGYNLETANSCGFAATGDIANASPAALFNSTLTYNGGTVSALLTFSLPTSSPAHNSADPSNCPETDERGFKRFESTSDTQCDIGAYEISATDTNFNVLDLALDIQYKNATPQNNSVQTTITFSVVNKGPLQASNVILTATIPTLSWLNITSWGAGSSSGICSQIATGVQCTIPTIDAYKSEDFFVATLASQAGSFPVDGEVKSDGAENYRPDNLKSATITIPTVSSSSSSGNNFVGTGGGGALNWLSLLVLLIPVVRRVRHR